MQKKALSYRLGRFINKLRWPIIGLWLLAILLCIPFLPHIIDPFKTTGFIDESSSSAYAENYMNKKLGYNDKNKFLIMYHSNKLLATQDQFKKKLKNHYPI